MSEREIPAEVKALAERMAWEWADAPESYTVEDLVARAIMADRASRAEDEARISAEAAEACLNNQEQRAQAMRCPCRGSDDYCPCQNVPDRETRRARAQSGTGKGGER